MQRPLATVDQEISELLREEAVRQASGLDLRRAKVMSPASTWIKMSLNSGFALMATHERRHLWQARQVLAAPGFPRGA